MRSKITNQQFDQEIVRVADVADRARDLALQKAERLRSFAGGAAVREVARLRAKEGADAASTLDAAGVMLARSRAITRLRDDVRAPALVKGLTPDTIAAGRIVAKGGRPAAGVVVTITTDAGRAIGEAKVDTNGAFRLDLPRAEFDKLVAGARSLVILVRDATGRDVYKAPAPILKRGAVFLRLDLTVRTGRIGGPEAQDGKADLTAIQGLGPARAARLADAGIETVADFVRLKPQALATLLHISVAQAGALLKAARKLQ